MEEENGGKKEGEKEAQRGMLKPVSDDLVTPLTLALVLD